MGSEVGLAAAKEALHRKCGTNRKVRVAILQQLSSRKEGDLLTFEDIYEPL